MSRLPTPGSDDGTWGDILNDFLEVEHNSDGTQKTLSVAKGGTGAADAATARTNLGAASASSLASKADDSSVVHLAGTETVTGAKDFTGGMTLNGNNVLSKLQDASDSELIPADYIVWMDGGTARATSLTGGTNYSNSDPANVTQSAINGLGTNGGTIVLRGSLAWGSVPGLPKGITNKLHIKGLGSTKITLSSGGPRFLDFNKTADYDTFQNIEITDLLIDCNNVGGRHHVVLGTYQNGTWQTRINIDKLRIDNIRTINVPSDSTLSAHRLNIWIGVGTPAGTTACSITNVHISNIRFEGGNSGCFLGAADAAAGANLIVDEVHVDRWWHSLMTVQTTNFSSSNVQLGSHATVRRVSITNGYGQYSGDVGTEIDNAQYAVLRDITIEDAFNISFLLANFVAAESPGAQEIIHERCRGRRLISTGGMGFRIDNVGGGAFGNLYFRDCEWHRTDGAVLTAGADGFDTHNTIDFYRIVIDGFDYVNENFNYTSGTNAQMDAMAFGPITTTRSPHVLLRDCRFRIEGTRNSGTAGVLAFCCMNIYGSTYSFEIEKPYFDFNVSNMSPNGTRLIELGRSSANLRGSIRGLRLGTITDDTGPRVIQIRTTATLAITQDVTIEDCDFVRAPSGVTEVLFVDNTNQPKVHFSNNKWRTYPKPSAAMASTNFASATFTTATANQYIGGSPAEIHFASGSGAGITLIEASKDGTTYEEMYAQASGAMAQDVFVPVDNGDYIRVTFSSTQPTTRVRFRR